MIQLHIERIDGKNLAVQRVVKTYAFLESLALISFGIIGYIQQNYSFRYGYIVSNSSLILSLIFFLIGSRWNFRSKNHESLVNLFFPVLFNSMKVLNKSDRDIELSSSTLIFDEQNISFPIDPIPNSIFDRAKKSKNGAFPDQVVEEIKCLRRPALLFLLLLPTWFLRLQVKIFRWRKISHLAKTHFQVETTYLVQGVHMKIERFFGKNDSSHYFPIVWFSVINQMIIVG